MKFLVACQLGAQTERLLGCHPVVYRPDLARAGSGPLREAITTLTPDVVVVDHRPKTQGAQPSRILSDGTSVPLVVKGTGPDADLEALFAAERLYTRHILCADTEAWVRERKFATRQGESVAVVGAGIVGMLVALRLANDGHRVRLIDARADPRGRCEWTALGCTAGGGNARMFTLTEGDNYNDQSGDGSGSDVFDRPVSQLGWRVCDANLDSAERDWVQMHRSLAPWRARYFNRQIFSFNLESRGLWMELRAQRPELFRGVELSDGILRLYSDPCQLGSSAALHESIGALRKVLDPGEVSSRYPALADACDGGFVAGAIEVEGFTVNVHNLQAAILRALQEAGCETSWNLAVRQIKRGSGGAVEGLVTESGAISSDHYVISPGAYGAQLLAGTASSALIQGVLGVWITLPNLEPRLKISMKIRRKGHMALDANVTRGRDEHGREVLFYGSGFGYTGINPQNIRPDELAVLYEAVEENARTYFPKAFGAAAESGMLDSSRKHCVRPWTSTGLGVFEVAQTASRGFLIIAGGHNTGGFAQAPRVAEAVASALRGARHPMHEAYHPARSVLLSDRNETDAVGHRS